MSNMFLCWIVSFLLGSMSLYVTSVGFPNIWYGPLRIGCNFLDFPFYIIKFGIKTYVPSFKLVAGVIREFSWD